MYHQFRYELTQFLMANYFISPRVQLFEETLLNLAEIENKPYFSQTCSVEDKGKLAFELYGMLSKEDIDKFTSFLQTYCGDVCYVHQKKQIHGEINIHQFVVSSELVYKNIYPLFKMNIQAMAPDIIEQYQARSHQSMTSWARLLDNNFNDSTLNYGLCGSAYQLYLQLSNLYKNIDDIAFNASLQKIQNILLLIISKIKPNEKVDNIIGEFIEACYRANVEIDVGLQKKLSYLSAKIKDSYYKLNEYDLGTKPIQKPINTVGTLIKKFEEFDNVSIPNKHDQPKEERLANKNVKSFCQYFESLSNNKSVTFTYSSKRQFSAIDTQEKINPFQFRK